MADGTGYGVASVAPVDTQWESTEHAPLTDTLGCTETRVDAYHLAAADPVDLPRDREQVVVSLGRTASPTLDGSPVPPCGAGRVPSGRRCALDTDRAVTVFVVSVPGSAGDGSDPTTLDLAAVEYPVPSTSDVPTARLTAPLGCTGLKANARVLGPDQAVPYHTEGSQEELFVPIAGPGAVRVAGETVPATPGTVVRVAPATPRSALTDGDARSRWVMFGAPPTGGPEEWDPGAVILE